jgi:hypothetical protein
VGVENGIVTLSGHVSSYAQKVSAEHAVKAIKACAPWPKKSRSGWKKALVRRMTPSRTAP